MKTSAAARDPLSIRARGAARAHSLAALADIIKMPVFSDNFARLAFVGVHSSQAAPLRRTFGSAFALFRRRAGHCVFSAENAKICLQIF
jgi:hypothetical protein